MNENNEPTPVVSDEDLAAAVDAAIEVELFERAGPWFKLGEHSLGRTKEEIVEKLKEEPELAGQVVELTTAPEEPPEGGDTDEDADGDTPPDSDEPPDADEDREEDDDPEPEEPPEPVDIDELVDKKHYGKNAFKITLPVDYTGPDHAVDFAHGVGVLCMLGFSYHRPEWVYHDAKKGWQVAARVKYPLFEPLLEYFQNKGAAIEKIGAKQAEKLLEQIRNDPESFASEPEEEEAEEGADPPPAKPEGGSDPKPHERV
jgi:hypothetical protein